MKKDSHNNRRRNFVQLFIAALIVTIFIGSLVPGSHYGNAGRIATAKTEMNSIVSAIYQYETAYGKFPFSAEVERLVSSNAVNFTYGTVNHGVSDVGGKSGKPLIAIANSGFSYTADNREVMAILLALPLCPDGTPTCNSNNLRNPQKTPFLNARIVGNTRLPGVGPDLVLRDPWGNPYIITIKLNDRGRTCDPFYGRIAVSEISPGNPVGFVNTKRSTDGTAFEVDSTVMLWSLGPDGKADANLKADQGVNKDNVISWQ